MGNGQLAAPAMGNEQLAAPAMGNGQLASPAIGNLAIQQFRNSAVKQFSNLAVLQFYKYPVIILSTLQTFYFMNFLLYELDKLSNFMNSLHQYYKKTIF